MVMDAQDEPLTDLTTRLRDDHGDCSCYLGLEAADWIDRQQEEIERLIRHLDWIGRVAPPDEPATALRAYAREAVAQNRGV